jgi:hypothetical protein
MPPLREVMQTKRLSRGGWRLALECAHVVVRRYVPVRARCSECEKSSFNGPLFNWQEHRATVVAWSLGSQDLGSVARTAAG